MGGSGSKPQQQQNDNMQRRAVGGAASSDYYSNDGSLPSSPSRSKSQAAAHSQQQHQNQGGQQPQRFPLSAVVEHRVLDWSRFYLETAASGDLASMMMVAQLSLQPGGYGEIPEDRMQAVKWLQHACNAGSGEAIVVFSNLCRELLAATVVSSDELVAEVRALVKPAKKPLVLQGPAAAPPCAPCDKQPASVDAVSGQKLTLSSKRMGSPDDSKLSAMHMSSAEDLASRPQPEPQAQSQPEPQAQAQEPSQESAAAAEPQPEQQASSNQGEPQPQSQPEAQAQAQVQQQTPATPAEPAAKPQPVMLRSVQAAREASRLGHYSTFVDVHNNRYRIPHNLSAASFAQLAVWCPLFSSLSDDDIYSCSGCVTPLVLDK